MHHSPHLSTSNPYRLPLGANISFSAPAPPKLRPVPMDRRLPRRIHRAKRPGSCRCWCRRNKRLSARARSAAPNINAPNTTSKTATEVDSRFIAAAPSKKEKTKQETRRRTTPPQSHAQRRPRRNDAALDSQKYNHQRSKLPSNVNELTTRIRAWDAWKFLENNPNGGCWGQEFFTI